MFKQKKTCGKEACQPKFYDSIKTTKERVDNCYLTLSKYFSDLALSIFLRKFATPWHGWWHCSEKRAGSSFWGCRTDPGPMETLLHANIGGFLKAESSDPCIVYCSNIIRDRLCSSSWAARDSVQPVQDSQRIIYEKLRCFQFWFHYTF